MKPNSHSQAFRFSSPINPLGRTNMPFIRRVLVAVLITSFSLVTFAEELNLVPTELTLVDGRKVPGNLACELETHLVLYSPGLGTLASFDKEFVASYTDKNTKLVKLSAPKTLTPDDLKKLNWKGWPDAAPESGPKPAYTTQKWGPPKRLLVWKKLTGLPKMGEALISGQNKITRTMAKTTDPDGWQVLGAPLVDGKWDAETDVILPGVDVDRVYFVQGPTSTYRHLVAENHAWIGLHSMTIVGNLWIHERGRCNTTAVAPAIFSGNAHTFTRNDRPTLFDHCRGKAGFSTDDKEMTNLTWDSRSYGLCQYMFTQKDKGMSVEIIGSFTSGDKFWTYTGITIIGPDSSVHADTRSGDHIYKDGTLQLMSGAHWHKFNNRMYGSDMEVDGKVEFGTKERPLTKDVVVDLGWKDYTAVNHKNKNHKIDWEPCGFLVRKQGTVRMCSADPKTARVVFRYLDRDGGPGWSDTGRSNNTPGPYYKELPRRIDILLLGDVELDGVHFEDLHKGGIRLGDLAMKSKLKNFTFGKNCGSSKPEELFSLYTPWVPPAGWTEDEVVKKATAEK